MSGTSQDIVTATTAKPRCNYRTVAVDCRLAILATLLASVLLPISVDARDGEEPNSDRRPAETTHDAPAEWQQRFKVIRPDTADAQRFVPGLIDLLRDDNTPDHVQRQAALLLGRIGRRAAPGVPVIRRILAQSLDARLRTCRELRDRKSDRDAHRDTDPQAACDRNTSRLLWSLKSVSLYGPVAAEAAPDVIRTAVDIRVSPPIRAAAYEALARIGPAHPQTLSVLADAVTHPQFDPQTAEADRVLFRATVLECTALLGPAAAPLLPQLIRLLDDPNELIRRRTLAVFAAIGRQAAPARDAVIDRLVFDPEPAVRDAAAYALGQMGPAATAALTELLADHEAEVRRLAATALQQQGTVAASAADRLRDAFRDESNPQVRIQIAEALWAVLPAEAPQLAEQLAGDLNSSDRSARIAAYRLLARLIAADREARQRLAAKHRASPHPLLARLLGE